MIASSDKEVERIAPPIPLELLAYGLAATLRALGHATLRDVPPSPDGGVIADYLGPVDDPGRLAARLAATPGVVEHGLFPPSLVTDVIVGTRRRTAVKLIDVTVPIRNGMPVYDRNPGVHLERARSIADGDTVNISRLDLGVHTGTHVDAPVHFIEGGAGTEAIDPEILIGEAHVVDATSLARGHRRGGARDARPSRRGRAPDLQDAQLGALEPRRASRAASSGSSRAARGRSLEAGVRLVGIDYLSIGDEAAHRVFLGNGVVPLEGLDLRRVDPGRYRLYCLPLKLVGSDGAPARVLLEPL